MTKAAIIITTNNRVQLATLCLDYLSKQIKRLKIDAEIFVMDSENKKNKEGAIKAGANYKSTENFPVSRKLQRLINWVKDENRFDGFIQIGSDDFLSDLALMRVYNGIKHYDYTQFNWLYVFDSTSKNMKVHHREKYWGAGRAFNAKALNKCNWKLLYEKINRGLDAEMTKSLTRAGLKRELFYCQYGELVLDVKTSENITNYQTFPAKEIGQERAKEIIEAHFKNLYQNLLNLKQ